MRLATLISGVVLGAVLGAGVGAWLVGRVVFWRSGAARRPARDRFGGPDCGVSGCAREVGHIGEHRRDPADDAWREPYEPDFV